jgi:transposase
MMGLVEEVEVWLHREPVDFRMQISGLVLRVEQVLAADPFARRVYAFTNRRRDRLRLLYWDRNGFALWLKRLEKDRFPWPASGDATIAVSRRELGWLLDGLDYFRLRPHEEIFYDSTL